SARTAHIVDESNPPESSATTVRRDNFAMHYCPPSFAALLPFSYSSETCCQSAARRSQSAPPSASPAARDDSAADRYHSARLPNLLPHLVVYFDGLLLGSELINYFS